MSSISVRELKNVLEQYPDDFEVVMNITEYDKNAKDNKKESIAYINAVLSDDGFREVYLKN